MERLPLRPEGSVPGSLVEERRQFADVMEHSPPGEQFAEDMQREIAEVIDGRERRECEVSEFAGDSAVPEVIHLRKWDQRYLGIPQAEVEVEGEGHIGINEIGAGPPASKASEGGHVVGVAVGFFGAGGFVSDGL
jgi:hypothetical protein